MSSQQPHFTAYKSVQELVELRTWFYEHATHDRRARAVSRTTAYLTRGHLPHSIESTSLITSVVLSDEAGSVQDAHVLQLSYTMALIKFVNGLLDPFQQSNFAIPLHTLASFLKLPSFFVELRHCGTHEFLPLLDTLRVVSGELLQWLYDNYWVEVDKVSRATVCDEETCSESKRRDMVTEMKASFKVYKRVRKLNLNKTFKVGDSTELGAQYWGAMKRLKKLYDSDRDTFVDILLTQRILNLDAALSEGKTNGIRMLYRPFLEHMGVLGPGFLLSLLDKLLASVSSDHDTTNQNFNWCQYILSKEFPLQDTLLRDTFDDVLSLVSLKNEPERVRLLEFVRDHLELSTDAAAKLESKLQFMKRFQIKNDKANELFSKIVSGQNGKGQKRDAMHDMASDLDNLKKRMKLQRDQVASRSSIKNAVIWERKKEWVPVPFGVPF